MISKFKAFLAKNVNLIRWILIAIVVSFATYYLYNQWREISTALAQIGDSWPSLVASFILILLGLFAGTMSWVTILNGIGPKVAVLRAMQVMLVGQLGKYVPGSVWGYVMQMEIGRHYGISRPRILVTSLYAAGIGVVASLLLGSLALPVITAEQPLLSWLFVLLPLGVACLHPRVLTAIADFVLKAFKRPPLDHIVEMKTVLFALVWALASYILFGSQLWVLANAFEDPNVESFVLLVGAISIGFTVSLFAFFLPSGIGVREAILISSMTLIVTTSQAAAISLVSRLLFTAADLLAAAAAALTVLLLRKKIAATVDEYSTAEGARS